MLNTGWKPCSALHGIENGRFNSSADVQRHPPGTVITYQCDTGHYIESLDEDFDPQIVSANEYSRTCERNGEWNMEEPYCEGTCEKNEGRGACKSHNAKARHVKG